MAVCQHAKILFTILGSNFIETERKCIVIFGSNDVCRGRRNAETFGDCVLCYTDECNGDFENGSIASRLTDKIFWFPLILLVRIAL